MMLWNFIYGFRQPEHAAKQNVVALNVESRPAIIEATFLNQTLHGNRAVARGGGAGGQCPHHESRLPPPPANFRNLANLEEALEKM